MGTSSGPPRAGKTVLLLSGTHEGPPLARALANAGCRVHATVTRPEACASLFGVVPDGVIVEARGFTEESLGEFLRDGGADMVLDATHPFAVRITRIARATCLRLGVRYVRFERADWEPPAGTQFVDSFAEAAARLGGVGTRGDISGDVVLPAGAASAKPQAGAGRVMFTIGAKQLKHFASLHGSLVMFARVLPAPASVQQALDAGFAPDRILGLRPPFSQAFNRAIFTEYAVDVLVTKASGIEGGVREKVLAAGELGMAVLMIRRPDENSGEVVNSLEAAVRACLT